MNITKEDLKVYIKTQEYLEFLYNLYYEKRFYPHYLNKIIKHKIRSEYRKTLKHKKFDKIRSLKYFVKKSKKVYDMIKDLKINEDRLTFDDLISLDKVIYYCSSRFRKYTKIFKLSTVTSDKIYCIDCKLEIYTKMKEYHVKGKKHIKNRNKEMFLYIDGDRDKLIKKGLKILNEIEKD